MSRFNEEITKQDKITNENVKKAMLISMKRVGKPVFSAATILSASFAAMMLSGILSLLQIGAWIIIGLTLYTIILLPVFIPAVATLLGENNWWPFNLISKK
ncbi:hypothetical protein SYNTR_0177 [Candidatus Syntrophocurvum alkaliphilum]|uniref:Membrane transport protein MMPL domain-containing protein n=2 Tax=Candidatus Syntrophocurvum alkaliphilum TaxID=2293317 RepID=A0A6I6DC84_9FIRM|nr:hypothetical protein SYNTR_0177 [Candidatus Syntrophocurvum alkaliphilum]